MQRSASLYIPYFEDEEEFNKNEFDDDERFVFDFLIQLYWPSKKVWTVCLMT